MSSHIQSLARELNCDARSIGVSGRRGFMLVPRINPGSKLYPWLWYAPTFLANLPNRSHLWLFRHFLAKGMVIAGIDIGESFGSPEGRAIYADFHDRICRDFGLAQKACLFAQSRGGLMLYNWAVEHPDDVACIAAVYPACDLRSYPGLDRAARAYSMSLEDLQRHLPDHNPVDRLAALAKSNVPIRHIHGNADTIVPLAANTVEVASRYKALNGEMDFFVVADKGHEVLPDYFERRELVDFIFQRGLLRIHWL